MILLLCFFATTLAAAQGQDTAGAANARAVPSAPATKEGTSDALASANALMRDGKYADAATAFGAIVEKDPTIAEAQAGLVRSLLRARKLDEAEEAGRKAAAAAPNSAAVHAAVGDVAFRNGKFGDAEAEYRAALRLDPNSPRGLYGIGRMYDMVSMHKRAKDAFARAHERDPEDKQVYSAWLQSLPYAEQLEAVKKAAGDSGRQKAHLEFLAAAAQKKPWQLNGEPSATQISMKPYGRNLVGIFTGSREGATPISKGYGLEVKFNGRASAVLLLDTGAGGIIIGRKLGERAGVVKIADSFYGGIGDQGPVRGYVGWVDKINIGSLEFHNCIVEVSSRTDIADESGLIGADIFEDFLVTLDFREWKLLLDPLPKNPGSASGDGPQDRYIAPEMQSFTKVYRFGHFLIIPVVVSDKVMGNFVLDTGSDLNTITPRLAQQVTKLNYEGMIIKGVSGSVKQVLSGDKLILQFGKLRVRSDDIPVFDLGFNSGSEGTDIAGLIGIRTLVQMKFTIDYRDGLVNFEPYERRTARE